jgi:hypothetical protein
MYYRVKLFFFLFEFFSVLYLLGYISVGVLRILVATLNYNNFQEK